MERRKAIKLTVGALSLAIMPPLLEAQRKRQVEPILLNKKSQNNVIMKIQRLDWAGIKIELDDTTLFVDATSYENQNDMKLSVETALCSALITHHHTDHFDPEALKTVFDSQSILYSHEKVLNYVDKRAFATFGLKLYQPVDMSRWRGDLVAIPVPAVDGFGHPQVSWVIRGGGKTIIHCGDTLWHGYWRDIAIAYGPFDLAFLPINGARINHGKVIDTGIPAILTPEQAVIAGKLLNAKQVCPIHYGRTTDTYFEVSNPEDTFLKSAKEHDISTLLLERGAYVTWK